MCIRDRPRGGPQGVPQRPDPAAGGGFRRGSGLLFALPPQQRDDALGTDIVDMDSIVNLVSVGTVQLAAGAVVTKIIEEQLLLSAGGGSTGAQKDVNAGGTNTISGST